MPAKLQNSISFCSFFAQLEIIKNPKCISDNPTTNTCDSNDIHQAFHIPGVDITKIRILPERLGQVHGGGLPHEVAGAHADALLPGAAGPVLPALFPFQLIGERQR